MCNSEIDRTKQETTTLRPSGRRQSVPNLCGERRDLGVRHCTSVMCRDSGCVGQRVRDPTPSPRSETQSLGLFDILQHHPFKARTTCLQHSKHSAQTVPSEESLQRGCGAQA